jgi:uncharacterized membrane protein
MSTSHKISNGFYSKLNLIKNFSDMKIATSQMPRLLALAMLSAIALVGSMPIASIAQPIQKFKIIGTEPFWGLAVSQSGFVYSTPERKRKLSNYVSPLKAQGRTADSLRVYRMQGNNTLIIQKGSCSDGMSDETYDYSAVLMMSNKVLSGCAKVEP